MDVDVDRSRIMAEAKAAMNSGDARRACELLRPQLPTEIDDEAYLSLRGAACCMAGFAEEGLAALLRVIELAPTAKAYYNLGCGYKMLGRIPEARTSFEQAVELEPGHARAAAALADILATSRPQPTPLPSAQDTVNPTVVSGNPKGGPSGPRTPEQIAMDEWDEEQAMRRQWREYVVSGLKYGASIGAILMGAQYIMFTFLGGVVGMMHPGESGGSILGIFVEFFLQLIVGAVYGSIIGLFVAWRDGGSLEGALAGAATLSMLVFVIGKISGADATGLYAIVFANAIFGGLSGALIGFLTRMSIKF